MITCYFEEDELLIEWSDVLSHKTLDENATFAFEYSRPNKKPKLVKFATQFVRFLFFAIFVFLLYFQIYYFMGSKWVTGFCSFF